MIAFVLEGTLANLQHYPSLTQLDTPCLLFAAASDMMCTDPYMLDQKSIHGALEHEIELIAAIITLEESLQE